MGIKIGNKMKGFKFEHPKIAFDEEMASYNNKIGTVTEVRSDRFKIVFADTYCWYPIIKQKIQNKLK